MASITLSHHLPGSLNAVYSVLIDFEKFGQLHPYMRSVKSIGHTQNEAEYLVHEKLRLWGIVPMKPCYTVTVVEIEKNKRIRYLSQVKPGLFLTIDFTLTYHIEKKETEVAEHLSLQGMPWVHSIFFSLLKHTHQQVFQSLKENSI